MKVSEEVPLILYCDKCEALGRFRGHDDAAIASQLAQSGWCVRRDGELGLSVLCPTCYVEDLRARVHHAVTEGGAAAGPKDAREETGEDVIRARRIEIIGAGGQPVFVARASRSRGGGQIAIMGPDGRPKLVASGSATGGVLAVADRSGETVWRAPCGNPECWLTGRSEA